MRGIISEPLCPFGCQEDEILSHLLFNCPHTSSVWHKFHAQVNQMQGPLTLQETITTPRAVNPAMRPEWATVLIAITWNIWLAGNRNVLPLYFI
jgi:hypothetical protein